MNRHRALLMIAAAILSGCGGAGFGSEEEYRNSLQHYVGASIDEVVRDFGYADYLSEAPSGNRLFIYSRSITSTSPVSCRSDSLSSQVCTGGSAYEFWCKTFFEVDAANLVVEFSFKGNNCR